MNISDEVIEAVTGIHPEDREYPDDVRRDFSEAAEWARKEALREAADAVDAAYRKERGDLTSPSYLHGLYDVRALIRALARGDAS
jgi:hypothetical protein